MSSNYAQIIDGINDQIIDLQETQSNYQAQLVAIQAELELIPPRLEALQAIKTQTEALSANTIDLNLNLNIAGASIKTNSTSVGY